MWEKLKTIFAILGSLIVGIGAFILGRKSSGARNNSLNGNGEGGDDRGIGSKLREANGNQQRIEDEQRKLNNAIDVSREIIGSNEILLNEAERIAKRNAEIARRLSAKD